MNQEIIQSIIYVMIFTYLIYRLESSNKVIREMISIREDLIKDNEKVSKAILYFESLRKQYYEMFVAESKDMEMTKLVEIAKLQNEQQQAILEENYELAQELQLKIKYLDSSNKKKEN